MERLIQVNEPLTIDNLQLELYAETHGNEATCRNTNSQVCQTKLIQTASRSVQVCASNYKSRSQ